MSVLFPVTPGGGIAASDSSSISTEIGVGGLTVGTKVWNVAVGAYFVFTSPSSASLVTDQVLAVKDNAGARWIKEVVIPAGSITNAMIADSVIDPLTKIDRTKIETMVTLVSANQDINITGLAGDSDGDYLLYAKLKFLSAGTCVIQPNGADPSVANTIGAFATGGVTGANGATANIKVADSGAAAVVTVVANLTSKSGVVRFGNTAYFIDGSSDACTWAIYQWLDTATVITSLKFHGNLSSLFDIGSFVRVVKMGHAN
jgi:hypothetical protein